MNPIKDITSKRFGRLLVLRRTKNVRTEAAWCCVCDCGNRIISTGNHLRSGNTKSCGCISTERISKLNLSHHQTGTPEHNSWKGLRQRCENPKHPKYKDYGGRGISVCKRWRRFENFLADMGKKPTQKHSIGRKNNNGNYEPSNCRWETAIQQANNTRKVFNENRAS